MTVPPRSLFRPEALAHAGDRRYGTILLAGSAGRALLVSLFVSFAIGLVVFLCAFSYTRKVRVSGVLLPTLGLLRVVPPQAGLVAERRVEEGRHVTSGEVLFVLTSERADDARGNAEATVARLLGSRRDSLLDERERLRRQSGQRIAVSRRRSDDLAAELQRADDQIVLQQRRIGLATAALDRALNLEAAHFLSAVQVQDKQVDLLDQRQRLAELQRARASTARERATAEAEQRDLAIQAERDEGGIERSVAGLEQEVAENDARRRMRVVAPHDGIVTAITAQAGQTVAAQQLMATILPTGSALEAELYAPSRAAGFLRPGMAVQLRYQAYAYQKFGAARGVVREVSRTAMRPDETTLPGASSSGTAGEPIYRVRVALDRQSVTAYGVDQPLRSGAGLDASILLETRRLYEWVLEPLYTITGRL